MVAEWTQTTLPTQAPGTAPDLPVLYPLTILILLVTTGRPLVHPIGLVACTTSATVLNILAHGSRRREDMNLFCFLRTLLDISQALFRFGTYVVEDWIKSNFVCSCLVGSFGSDRSSIVYACRTPCWAHHRNEDIRQRT